MPKNNKRKVPSKCSFCGISIRVLKARGWQLFASPLAIEPDAEPAAICTHCVRQLGLALKLPRLAQQESDPGSFDDFGINVHPEEARELKDIEGWLQDVAFQHKLGADNEPAGDGVT